VTTVLPAHDPVSQDRDEGTKPPEVISLAVWDIPSPVVAGERFAIKVGAKSSAEIALTGSGIEICDGGGIALAQGYLAAAPLPGTSALYWVELEVPAPAAPGMHAWSARFAPVDLALEHKDAIYKFDVLVVPPPEHRLTVRVVERDSETPIEDAQVRLGAYRAATDRSGHAEIALPKGSYNLTVWKVGYEAPQTSVEMTADLTLEVAVAPVPEENPDAAWMM
jgi:carboxypeptidase family protein